tara:strand:+ start:2383 stop:2859 length:477 start_codon:yes stop_codon:yes gene_type:complete
MDFLLNHTYTNKQQQELISRWDDKGWIGQVCYSQKFKIALCYENLLTHITKEYKDFNVDTKCSREEMLFDTEMLASTLSFPLLYRLLKSEKNVFFYNIPDLYDDFKKFIKENLHMFELQCYHSIDVESYIIRTYQSLYKKRIIKKHFMFKKLLTEKKI